MRPGLERLFRPGNIAVVGGGAWCENVIRQCRAFGFAGPIWPVHPDKPEIGGAPAYPDIGSLPSGPDATFVGVNRHATIDIVSALRRKGAGGAVCFAAGFAEARDEVVDGPDLQRCLLDAAGEMALIGPNCYGFVNYLDGALLWPDQHGGARRNGGVAIITQSSNIAINLTMQKRGLPIGYVVTAGNQAQTGFARIGEALLRDPRVTALGLHIEGIGDLRAFEQLAATAITLNKPIVVLKVGRSLAARTATVSHTASIAGSDAGARALFERLGIGQTGNLADFLETLKLLHVTGPLRSNRIASMSCSGGEASLIADLSEGRGLSFPALNERQRTGLRAALGPMVKLANPLDYNTYIWPRTDAMAATFTAMLDPGLALGLVVLDFPRADRCDGRDWANVIEATRLARDASGVPVAIIASLPENLPEETAERLVTLEIAPICGMAEALAAIAIAAWLGGERRPPAPLLPPCPPIQARALSEAEAKAALADHGLATPSSRCAGSPEAAARMAAEIGFPVALKGAGLVHKTEARAVTLDLVDTAAVFAAAQRMSADRFLVEEMIADEAAELLVGIVLDPAHGYVLTLGAGGVLAELMADTVSLLVPASPADIAAALQRLRLCPLLTGYRGRPAADIDAVVRAVMAVQAFVTAQHGRVEEVEINPLLCCADRAVAVDALVRIGDADD